MIAVAVFPEGGIPQSSFHLALTLGMTVDLIVGNTEVSFRTEHSMVTYPQHLEQPRVSVFDAIH